MESRRLLIALTVAFVPAVWVVANSEDLILNKYLAGRVVADFTRSNSLADRSLSYPLRFTSDRKLVSAKGVVVFMPSCQSCTIASFPMTRLQGSRGPVILVAPDEKSRRQIMTQEEVGVGIRAGAWKVVSAGDFRVAESGVWFPAYRAFRFDQGAILEEVL